MDKRFQKNKKRYIRDFNSLSLGKLRLSTTKLEIPELSRGSQVLYGLKTIDVVIFILAATIFIGAHFLKKISWIIPAAYISALLLAGWNVFYALYINITEGKYFCEELIFTVSAAAFLAVGQFPGGTSVMLAYRSLRLLESFLAERRYDIRQRLEIPMPAKCRVETTAGVKKTRVEKVKIGQIVIVKPGEIIPIDGRVIEGSSLLDTFIITGSEDDLGIGVGDKAVSGCTNLIKTLRIEACETYDNSTANIISDILYASPDYKSDEERTVCKYAGKLSFVLGVCGMVLAVVIPLLFSGEYMWNNWISRGALIMALSMVNILVETVPFAYLGAVAVAAEQGIIINGNRTVEKISNLVTVAFNKNGTLTENEYSVVDAVAHTVGEEELLSIAAAAEQFSSHPIAKAICRTSQRFAREERKKAAFEEIPCRGVSAHVKGHHILAGNAGLLEEQGIRCDTPRKGKIAIHVAMDEHYCGYIVLSNKPRDKAFETLEGLRHKKVRNTVMLTGDLQAISRKTASALNMDMVKSELDKEGKLSAIAYLRRSMTGKNCFAYVSRKCEDPEFLRQADVGISVGSFGCNKVLEYADVLIMEDDLSKVATLVDISGNSKRVININLAVVLTVKAIELVLALFGLCGAQSLMAAELAAAMIVSINTWRVIFNKL